MLEMIKNKTKKQKNHLTIQIVCSVRLTVILHECRDVKKEKRNLFKNRFDAAFKFNSLHYLAQSIPSSFRFTVPRRASSSFSFLRSSLLQ